MDDFKVSLTKNKVTLTAMSNANADAARTVCNSGVRHEWSDAVDALFR